MPFHLVQVEFSDSSMSPELSAVQVNEDSTFMAEETYFTGFASEVSVGSTIHFLTPLDLRICLRLMWS